MMAGRRMTQLAEQRAGLLTGWYNRSRACRLDGEGPFGTLLSLGVCEMEGVVKGDSYAFLELLEAISGPAQVVLVPDSHLVSSARVVIEQLRRKPEELQTIARDYAESLLKGDPAPDAADWMFTGAVLSAMNTSPTTEIYAIVTRRGLRRTGPPDAILLSLHAENALQLRHRKLGYTVAFHSYRLADAGPAFRSWLRTDFEVIARTAEQIAADYREMIDLIRARSPSTHFVIANMMSTFGDEDFVSYAAFERPLANSIKSVQAKDLNLMLIDLSAARDVSILDTDAIAAELGARLHIPDGMHHNGPMQAEIRGELLHILRARRTPGFAPRKA